MAQEPIYLTTPVGRFVMGDAFTGSDKDQQGRPLMTTAGKPKVNYFQGIAFAKNDPAWQQLWAQIYAVGQRDFPNGAFQRPDFAWKVVDGDLKYADRPECRGHNILRLSSGFPPKIFNAQNLQITDPAQCKRGYYVRAYISVQGNDDTGKPGLYISPSLIQVCGYGEEIISGPSAAQVFAAPAALPPGASAVPVAPAGPMVAPTAPPAGHGPPQPAPAYTMPAAHAAPPPAYGPPPAAYAPPAPAPVAPAPTYAPPPGGYPAPVAAPTAPGSYGPPPAAYAPAPAPQTAYPGNPPPYPEILQPPAAPAPAAYGPPPAGYPVR